MDWAFLKSMGVFPVAAVEVAIVVAWLRLWRKFLESRDEAEAKELEALAKTDRAVAGVMKKDRSERKRRFWAIMVSSLCLVLISLFLVLHAEKKCGTQGRTAESRPSLPATFG